MRSPPGPSVKVFAQVFPVLDIPNCAVRSQLSSQVLQTPHNELGLNEAPITPALLRLDPLWDPLRSDPAFQKLCEEKQH